MSTKTNVADTKASQAKSADAEAFLGTILPTEAAEVTKAAKATLSTAKTLATRSGHLGDTLAAMLAKAEADGVTFADYAKAASFAIAAAGDWEMADADIRKAVAAIAGTRGRLSSVMVAEAVGLSQSTANRAIRAAKAAHVDAEAAKAAEAVIADAMAAGHDSTDAEVIAAAKAAEADAKAKATAEAEAIVTAAGYVTTSGRGSNATTPGRVSKGASVAKSLAADLAKVDTLADGTVSAEALATLAADMLAKAEALAAKVAVVKAAETEAAKVAEAEAKAAEAAEAAKAADAEAKAVAKATKAEARRVRPIVAAVIGGEATANLSDAEVVERARDMLTAAKSAVAV